MNDLVPQSGADLAPVIDVQATDLVPAGYDARELDGALGQYLDVVNSSLRKAQSIGRKLDAALKNLDEAKLRGKDDSLAEADALTILFDRQAKATLNVVKALDEMTRLRSFIAGGPDSRPDLTVKGEVELRGVILHAIKQLGMSCPHCSKPL